MSGDADVPGSREQRGRSATIRDVADAAQVSITTVSHVFNKPHRVAEETRRRVRDAAADLSYRPNEHARQLVTRRSRSLAIQVAGQEVRHEHGLVPNSEYFLEVLNGAARAAEAHGYALILTSPEVAPAALDAFAVDGVLVVDPAGDEPVFGHERLARKTVTIGHTRGLVEVPLVVDNNHAGAAEEVLDHLAGQGYELPAVVVSDLTRSYVVDLVDGYVGWMTRRGGTPLVAEFSPSDSMGEVLDELLGRGADAVYTGSEYLALDVLVEARERGLAIPDQLGVCSGVDSGILGLSSPQVTGLFLHPRQIGGRAIELLIDLIEGEAPVRRAVEVPTELVVRESTRRRG